MDLMVIKVLKLISVFGGVVEEERCILRNKKKTDIYLHLKARVCHVLLVKDELTHDL